jgi:hypothetical protein
MGLQELGFNLVREEGFMPWKKRKDWEKKWRVWVSLGLFLGFKDVYVSPNALGIVQSCLFVGFLRAKLFLDIKLFLVPDFVM